MTQLIIHDDIDIFLPQRFPDVRDDLLHGRKTGRVIPPDPGKYSKPLVLLVNLKLPVQAIDGEDWRRALADYVYGSSPYNQKNA